MCVDVLSSLIFIFFSVNLKLFVMPAYTPRALKRLQGVWGHDIVPLLHFANR